MMQNRFTVVTVNHARQHIAHPAYSWLHARSILRKLGKEPWLYLYIRDRECGMVFDLRGARLV